MKRDVKGSVKGGVKGGVKGIMRLIPFLRRSLRQLMSIEMLVLTNATVLSIMLTPLPALCFQPGSVGRFVPVVCDRRASLSGAVQARRRRYR